MEIAGIELVFSVGEVVEREAGRRVAGIGRVGNGLPGQVERVRGVARDERQTSLAAQYRGRCLDARLEQR